MDSALALYRLKQTVVAFILVLHSGCASMAYYAQAVNGHMEVMRRSQPINVMIADPDVDPDLKQTLSKVVALRRFASLELKLPDNRSYTHYADLERPYVVWNVVATPEFSTKPIEWCFIKAGCVSYRGFFSQTKAEMYAEKLQTDGYDVHVRGVPAYSTLGWFNDPVLNTFSNSEMELARLIFHELAHQVLYVPGDTVFNESFATLVEQEGVRRWLVHNNTLDQYAEYLAQRERQSIFNALVINHRKRLESLFDTDLSDTEKRVGKARVLNDLREQFALLKNSRAKFSLYDRWFEKPLNNARLATAAVYTQLLPAFQALLNLEGGDMADFFKRVKTISKLSKEERLSALQTAIHENQQGKFDESP